MRNGAPKYSSLNSAAGAGCSGTCRVPWLRGCSVFGTAFIAACVLLDAREKQVDADTHLNSVDQKATQFMMGGPVDSARQWTAEIS